LVPKAGWDPKPDVDGWLDAAALPKVDEAPAGLAPKEDVAGWPVVALAPNAG